MFLSRACVTFEHAGLMQRLNPTGSLLRARPFVARHDYIFTLLCLLNVNMGALNNGALLVGNGESMRVAEEDRATGTSVFGETAMDFSLEMVLAQGLMDDMAGVFQEVKQLQIFLTDALKQKLIGIVGLESFLSVL